MRIPFSNYSSDSQPNHSIKKWPDFYFLYREYSTLVIYRRCKVAKCYLTFNPNGISFAPVAMSSCSFFFCLSPKLKQSSLAEPNALWPGPSLPTQGFGHKTSQRLADRGSRSCFSALCFSHIIGRTKPGAVLARSAQSERPDKTLGSRHLWFPGRYTRRDKGG